MCSFCWLRSVLVVRFRGGTSFSYLFLTFLIGGVCDADGFPPLHGYRCNAYNVSSAAACFLCVAFGVSVFFDVKNLHTK